MVTTPAELGEFNIPMDKRQPYDWDTRIHLLALGPGIAPGSTWKQPATQVDMAPTFLGLAGLAKSDNMDGKSLVPLLMPGAYAAGGSARQGLAASTSKHLDDLLTVAGDAGATAYASDWRTSAFIEYYYVADNDKCMANCHPPRGADKGYPHEDTPCGDLTPGTNNNCWSQLCTTDCYPTESIANNFIVLRSMADSAFGNTMYAEFQTGNLNKGPIEFTTPDFYEFYDVSNDTWMMNNLYNHTSRATIQAHHDALQTFFTCAGDTCP